MFCLYFGLHFGGDQSNSKWNQIATRYLMPELAGTKLTLKLCSRVAEAFVSKYGEYAGWAQTLLFIAELPAQKALLQSFSQPIKPEKSAESKIASTR